MVGRLFITTLWHWTTTVETLPPFAEICSCGKSVKARVQEELHRALREIIKKGLPGSIGERCSEEVGKMSLLDKSLDMLMEYSVIFINR